MKYFFRILFFLLLPLYSQSCKAINPNDVYIRTSQVGFLPGDLKNAVVFSMHPVFSHTFKVIDEGNNNEIFSGSFYDSSYTYDKFNYCYLIDFSKLNIEGTYRIEVDGQKSHPFSIRHDIFNKVVDSLTIFFKVQRCGPTNPYMHGVCHLSDVSRISGSDQFNLIDVTGGWHDAGDYIKFFTTTAYTTYLLLFSYEFDPVKFGFDNDNNNVPDILEEARIGIDWLLRSNYTSDSLITQVQDLRDHDVGWRLPEYDTLRYDRVGHIDIGKNQVGMFAAVMSMASRIWKNKFLDDEFSNRCLDAGKHLYSLKDKVPDTDKSPSGFYQDNEFFGKLALGAAELYLTTGHRPYLYEAMEFADSAGSDYWWSWGNINSFAHYRLASYEPRFKDYIRNSLIHYSSLMYKTPFRNAAAYTWGTTKSMLGITLKAILYKNLTGTGSFDSLAISQRDYVLGTNPWGLSFIYGIGSDYPERIHSQVAFFNNGRLPGGLVAGPAPAELLDQYEIERSNFKFDIFNSDSVKYFDDFNDYITNEPTIGANATAIFVYGYYSSR